MDDVDSESKQVLYNLWLRAVFFVYFKFAPYQCACCCVASLCDRLLAPGCAIGCFVSVQQRRAALGCYSLRQVVFKGQSY